MTRRFDNQEFDVNGDKEFMLVAAMQLAFKSMKYNEVADRKELATHYVIKDNNKICFYWHEPESTIKATPLPFSYDEDDMISFVRTWLKQATHGEKWDTDGDNQKGWRVYYSKSHQGEDDIGSFYSLVAVEAIWTNYGK